MELTNADKLPAEVVPLLKAHVDILLRALGGKLTGVYVHGSAAMGGFNSAQSDLDYLAVISTPLMPKERKELADSFLRVYGKNAPAKGVEMSIVVESFAGKEFRYPTPYEFHMGTKEQVSFHGTPHLSDMADPDLAAHFTIIKKRGLCVYGKPINEVFAEVPATYYLASLSLDSEESFKNIQEKTGNEQCVVPQYAVLNFCRVLALIDEGLMTSKIEGAQWALKKLPDPYHRIILSALQEYRETGSSGKVDPIVLKEFAAYAQNRIRIELSRNHYGQP